jgi:hypothetical protein
MLAPGSPIASIGFETGPKGFDDVWVAYHPGRGRLDAHGNPLSREHVQCKWHASLGTFGHKDLIDPDFINATSRSLLQRAHGAQQYHVPLGAGVRFSLTTNWSVDRADALSPLVHTRHGNLRLDRLFEGKTEKSATGALRKVWQDHLGVDDDDLRRLAGVLGFSFISESLDDLRQHLDTPFQTAGLMRVAQHESAFVYDEVLFQWLAQDRLVFDAKSLRDRCRQEGLLGDATDHPRTFGVKSFEHAFDPLEERCDEVLNLLSSFQERYILDADAWESDLLPRLTTFLRQAGRSDPTLRLVLDTHASLAFAAGSVLNVKSGRAVILEQRTIDRRLWSANDVEPDPSWATWILETQTVGTGPDLAVAVSLTNDVVPKVLQDLKARPEIGRLLIARPSTGPGGQVITSGRHAYDLAASLVGEIQAIRSASARTHLYIAAPNSFTFFLGQRQAQLGPTTLYEFDFEGDRGGGYTPALKLPSGTSLSPLAG